MSIYYRVSLYGLVSVSESVSVIFSVLYLVSKVSEKSGIGTPLVKMLGIENLFNNMADYKL